MKRILLFVDAAADFPFPELGDETPLAHAKLPYAAELASEGACGNLKLRRVEADASRSLLAEACGLDTRAARDLRWGPVAAASLGMEKTKGRFRTLCHFLHVDHEGGQNPHTPSSLEEHHQLVEDLEAHLSTTLDIRLIPMQPGRFVLDLPSTGLKPLKVQVGYEREGAQARLLAPLRDVIRQAERFLETHPVNQIRQDLGEPILNSLWCWSGGQTINMPPTLPFRQALMSPDPLVRGLAELWGLPFIPMEDPFVLDRPDAAFEVFELLKTLDSVEEILVWVPAPFASNKYEGPEEKVRRLAAVDYYVTGPLLAIAREQAPCRMLLASAGLRHRGRPEKGVAPFALWGEGVQLDPCRSWTEIGAQSGSLGNPKFQRLLDIFRTETS